MNKTRRLFVGVPLSGALRKRLTREMQLWPSLAMLRSAEENLHVTLLYLGFVNEEQIAEISQKLGEVCAVSHSFDLVFSWIKLKENKELPKMIWLEGEASDDLKYLVENIEKAFAVFISEKKSYRPHVTLGKIRKSVWLKLQDKPQIEKKLRLAESVDAVCLYESLSIHGKRRYEPIDSFPLA